MGKYDNDIVETRICSCGCGNQLALRRWHFNPSKAPLPRFIKGHQQFGNKRGWKGGEIKESHGYVLVYCPDHPYKNAMGRGYVKRSRLVMEKLLGRYLEPHEIVHHINGIKNDDRPENLSISTNPEHLSLHHKEVVKRAIRDNLGRFIRRESDANARKIFSNNHC